MKKIAFITIHVGTNFGSVLQAIATSVIINRNGAQAELINYIPPRCTWKYYFNVKGLLEFIKKCIYFPIAYCNKRIYTRYLKKHLIVSEEIYKEDNFQVKCPPADIYMTGSDQVWNSIHNQGLDYHYFFKGFPEETIKISFSSSIGRENIDKEEFDEFKLLLSTYKAISVREESAKCILKSMGYEAIQLLDPTFLIDKRAWTQYMSPRLVKKPYLLIYTPYDILDKELVYKSARKIASSRNLDIVTFTYDIRSEKLADKTIKFASPGDFLSLMYYADYVLTTSFHGTAFSINLNKQFYVYLPSRFGTRITSILSMCKLESRLLSENELISEEKINTLIDYNDVNTILDQERKIADKYLMDILMN